MTLAESIMTEGGSDMGFPDPGRPYEYKVARPLQPLSVHVFHDLVSQKEHKDEVSRKYRITQIGVFGSFVRGEQKRQSDVDILVEFDRRHIPGLLAFSEMEKYLEKLLRKKVDLVRKGGIRPELKKIILKEVVYI